MNPLMASPPTIIEDDDDEKEPELNNSHSPNLNIIRIMMMDGLLIFTTTDLRQFITWITTTVCNLRGTIRFAVDRDE